MKNPRSATSINAGADAPPKRRWFRIGPATVLTLAISALLGSQWIRTHVAVPQPSVPPIVERQVISSSYGERSGPTPEVSFILDRAGKLHLTDAQLVALESLKSRWEKYYAPKIAQANQAAAATAKYLAEANGRSRTPVARIQDEAAPVITVSGEISSARRSYWGRAVSLLSPKQRALIQQEREADWQTRTQSPSRP